MKAGIMEIGDIIVLNKADRNGIDQLESYVNASLELMPSDIDRPEVVRISAVNGEGLEKLWEAIDRLLLKITSEERKNRSAIQTLNGILEENGRKFSEKLLDKEYNGRDAAERLILSGKASPYAVGKKLQEAAERMFQHNEC